MEEILEIRDGCATPVQLLKSKAFAKYLNIYKNQFIKEVDVWLGNEHSVNLVTKNEVISILSFDLASNITFASNSANIRAAASPIP